MNNQVVLVNEKDEIIGVEEKLKAHQKALLHRAFSVFVLRLNKKGEIELLLQKRQVNKYHSGGLWTNTCCSHPQPHEDIITAGEQRLFEEAGLKLRLTSIGKFHYKSLLDNELTENEWDHVLVGKWTDEIIKANPAEAEAYEWRELGEIQAALKRHSEKYTAWFAQALNLVIKNKTQVKKLLR